MAYSYPRLTLQQEDDILNKLNYTRVQLENDKWLLRTWLNEQEHLPECRKKENDAFLVSYLVGCKGSMEKAKKKLDAYYSIRGHGDLFTERDTLDYVKSADNFQCFAAMPQPTPDGNIITLMMVVKEVEKCNMLDAFKKAILHDEWRLREGSGIRGGSIYLADARDFSAGHLMKMSPSVLKSTVSWIQDAYPLRMTKFVVFNAEPIFDTFANTMIRPLLSEKLKKRFIVTKDSDISKYFEHIDLLPSTYGGKVMDKITLSREFSSLMKARVVDILPTLGQKTDDSKRPKHNGFTENPHFGAFGSIKTLVTD